MGLAPRGISGRSWKAMEIHGKSMGARTSRQPSARSASREADQLDGHAGSKHGESVCSGGRLDAFGKLRKGHPPGAGPSLPLPRSPKDSSADSSALSRLASAARAKAEGLREEGTYKMIRRNEKDSEGTRGGRRGFAGEAPSRFGSPSCCSRCRCGRGQGRR